jgi:hypothetical protein
MVEQELHRLLPAQRSLVPVVVVVVASQVLLPELQEVGGLGLVLLLTQLLVLHYPIQALGVVGQPVVVEFQATEAPASLLSATLLRTQTKGRIDL